jgi:hypothetical protein
MDIEYEKFYEEITIKAITDTIANLLKHPFGFHGDTGIRDYLYARLHVYGGDRLIIDHQKPGYSTLLLQSEHYTLVKYKNTGKTGKGARFDIALTSPPKSPDVIEDRFAENLEALFAFELGKNKPFEKIIDPNMLSHNIDTIPGTSDISKLYLELKRHKLKQGWVIEFYDSRSTNGASIVSKTLDISKNIELPEGKKLVAIFVGFSADGKHHVSSNDLNIEALLIGKLVPMGINASRFNKPVPLHPGRGWSTSDTHSASVEQVFGDRSDFANRIIKIGAMEECGRSSQYVNLSFGKRKNIAQIHPHESGIAFVLRSKVEGSPSTSFSVIPFSSLAGYTGTNAKWLDGVGPMFERKGPAIAFLIPDEVDELGDDSKEWKEILQLLEHAKTSA